MSEKSESCSLGSEGIGEAEDRIGWGMGEVLRVGEVWGAVGSIEISIDPRRDMCTFGCCITEAERRGKIKVSAA